MKILTLNTWQERGPWRDRWKLILKGFLRHRPDVIFLQEVFNPRWAKMLPAKAGYRYSVSPAKTGGLMILSRFPVMAWERLVYKTASPTEDYSRYALFAKLRIKGREVAFFNTHLSWRIPETRIRQKQVKEMILYMNVKAKHIPLFAAGDFNAHPATAEIQLLKREGRLTDLYETRNPGHKGWTWDNKNPYTAGASVRMPDRRIDFIWMRDPSKQFKIRSAQLVYNAPHGGIYPSDHNGVLTEVLIPELPAEAENE